MTGARLPHDAIGLVIPLEVCPPKRIKTTRTCTVSTPVPLEALRSIAQPLIVKGRVTVAPLPGASTDIRVSVRT